MTTVEINLFKPHIREAVPYKGGAVRPESGAVRYKLSSNENMLGPSPKALRAIRESIAMVHEYNFESDQPLCEALAVYMKGALKPQQFITGNGGMELLDMIVRGFIEPGDEVLISSPTFMAYKNFAVLGGAAVIDVPLRAPDYQLNVQGLLAAVTGRTKLIFLTSPNNPTGTVIGKMAMDDLMEKLPDSVVVIFDEVYHHYNTDSKSARAIDYIRVGKNVIGMHSFSKAFGLAGMRLAYAFSNEPVAGYLRRIRRPFMIPVPGVMAAVAALDDYQHIRRTQAMNSRGKAYLYREFQRLGISYTTTEGNFILITPPAGMTAARCVEQMQLLGVMIRSTDVMLAPGKVRITIGTPEANGYLVDCFERILKKQSSRK